MGITKKMRLQQITQTAARSQAVFIEDQKAADPGKPLRPGKVFSFISDEVKDLAGLEIDKVYTVTIS